MYLPWGLLLFLVAFVRALTVRVVCHEEWRKQQGDEGSGVVDAGEGTGCGVVTPAQWLPIHLNRYTTGLRVGNRFWESTGLAGYFWDLRYVCS